ncbi:MAG: hypothetical protein A2Y75_09515 [Candidatus Solincola sediminis]|uniref:Uncharacterized protein n=1 Tax=Candidatus Solincola sediminis TaxID=1797199 RepID=A0A1F2WFD5_9ACTN|nr:MAG: hypothetical protein A2Y75_09515 [Candidatus Solincola sediminis]
MKRSGKPTSGLENLIGGLPMKTSATCGECGIPLGIARTHNWNSNGTITEKGDPRHRMLLFESDNLDRLWRRLSEVLGVTLEHLWELVITSKSHATRSFLHSSLPWWTNLLVHFLGYRSAISRVEAQGLLMGYGKITLGGQYPERGRPERVTVFIEDPYSLPLFCGDCRGSAEVLERRDVEITYQALDARRHQIDMTMKDQHMGEGLFEWREPALEPGGDIEYERCLSCGSPLELKRFAWNLDTGVIRDTETGRRIALFGSQGLILVFQQLVHEFGDRVMEAITEIERENTLTAMSRAEAESGFEGLRMLAAIRGMGLITRLEMDETGMNISITNPSIPAYLAGLALGIFELATGIPARHRMQAKATSLDIQITP